MKRAPPTQLEFAVEADGVRFNPDTMRLEYFKTLNTTWPGADPLMAVSRNYEQGPAKPRRNGQERRSGRWPLRPLHVAVNVLGAFLVLAVIWCSLWVQP